MTPYRLKDLWTDSLWTDLKNMGKYTLLPPVLTRILSSVLISIFKSISQTKKISLFMVLISLIQIFCCENQNYETSLGLSKSIPDWMHGARLKGKVQLIIVNELIASRDNSDAAIFVSDLFNDIRICNKYVFIYCFGIDEFPIACMRDNKCIISYIGGTI